MKAVILDFDGIILESVDIKGWAFRKLFEDYPQHLDTIHAFHYANGGMPRFDKFRYIYKEILQEPLPEERFKELCERYSALVFERVLACDFVAGALEFLKKYHQSLFLFIVSGTPQEEMTRVVKARRLDSYFKGVFGSPKRKGYWTKRIMDEYRLDGDQVLWVGDAMSDLRAARENNIKFAGRVVDDNDIFRDEEVNYKIKDLFELDRILQDEQKQTGERVL
jgi:phosphoglycolate phosphatase-like HAD superfamily hydrolase